MPMSAIAKGWLTATFVVLMATEGAYAQPQDIAPVNSGRHPRLGGAHLGEEAVGRIQRSGHR